MTEQKPFFKSRPWKVFVVTFSISFPIFLLSRFDNLFLILVVSFAVTFILRPLIDQLEDKGIDRMWAVLGTFIVLGSIIVVAGMILYPLIVTQMLQISTAFSGDKLTIMLDKLSASIAQQVPFIKTEAVQQQLHDAVSSFGTSAGSSIEEGIGLLANLAIVPFISFFLLNDYYKMQKIFIQNMPNKYFEMTLNIIHKLEEQLTKYIRGTVTESFFVAILYTLFYFYYGINYATVLGLIGGIANIIPFAGPFIGAIPVLLISIIQFGDLRMLPWIVISTIVVQQIDQFFIQPAVFSKIMDIHPLTMFLVILVGNEVLGVMGMVLAVPIYTVIFVTAKETNWGLKKYKITW